MHFPDLRLTEFLQTDLSFCEDFATSISKALVNAYSKYGGINASVLYKLLWEGLSVNGSTTKYNSLSSAGSRESSIVYFLEPSHFCEVCVNW